MNSTHSNETKEPRQEERKDRARPQEHESASQRATEKAKRGEPLNADRPRERSPKQENL